MTVRRIVFLAFLMANLPVHSLWATGNVLLPADNGGGAPNLGLIPSEPESVPAPSALLAQPPVPSNPKQNLPAKQDTAAASNNSLIVAFANPSPWTTGDISIVSRQLGIPSNAVVNRCQIGVNGALMSDGNSFSFDSNLATSVQVPYNGMITNAFLNIYAACFPINRPAPNFYSQQTDNRLIVNLGSANCTPRSAFNGTMRRLLIVHTANGNDGCVYQK